MNRQKPTGKYASSRTNADKTIDAIRNSICSYQEQADRFQGHMTIVNARCIQFDRGEANRLNDFVRELRGRLNNLELFLEDAGANEAAA